ncbi:cysteinyl-tRNA synthetase, partial [mine drainage metagenome]
WPSPWGPGRPGWHIEDTAITNRLLGPQYDLHGGGLDLKFPHHEAEIAQSEGATGLAPMVAFWMHSGLLTLKGEKMSKSLGNVTSLSSAIDAEGPEVLRFYYLNAHYRNPLDFDPAASFAEAREAYRRLREPLDRLEAGAREPGPRGGTELPEELAVAAVELEDRLDELMADDFRTRESIAELFGWGRRVLEWLESTAEPSP